MSNSNNTNSKKFLNPVVITIPFREDAEDFLKILDAIHGSYQDTVRSLISAFVGKNRRFLKSRSAVTMPDVLGIKDE